MAIFRPVKVTQLTDQDIYLFNEGNHFQLYDKLGAHPTSEEGVDGTYFAVWAPNAERVSVVGDMNYWNGTVHPLTARGSSGIWTGFLPGTHVGQLYKYRIWPRGSELSIDKADPYAFLCETPPNTASVIWNLDYEWHDREWMSRRLEHNRREVPMSIYELHLGSWMRSHGQHGEPLGYRQIAEKLADYVGDLGFTHVEIMPVMEHPFYGSWGYQVTGYFAPTSRYGTPQDFMYLIDYLHQRGIGVILDWVPAHFPDDPHSLGLFDGTHLYEHADPRKGFHPDWKSLIFNYGRYEVKSFLISSARFWLDYYHADALRVDGVASMLYLDYSRGAGEWVPNEDGSNENRDAVAFIRQFNEVVYRDFPDVQTIAEESTSWANVSRPTAIGGLGFGFKWDMGWMHDTLKYMARDPIHRKWHHDELTFRSLYTYTENFVLPLSHDEVVHGKGSLLGKMPGDDWQQRANLRLLFGYMYAQPGKKLVFMGGELGTYREWNHDDALEWSLLGNPAHAGIHSWLRDLNRFYRDMGAMHHGDVEAGGMLWIQADDAAHSVLAFIRQGHEGTSPVVVVCNFTPTPRKGYRLGVPSAGVWREAMNSDGEQYGGSGAWHVAPAQAEPIEYHGRPQSIVIDLPPLACAFLMPEL